MSTRCNVIISDGAQSVIFYRHSDGYPKGVNDSLQKFAEWGRCGKIRNNVGQASGWIVLLGAIEYQTVGNDEWKSDSKPRYQSNFKPPYNPPADWKCGAYEPTTGIHGDICYLYLVDLKTWQVFAMDAPSDEDERTFEDFATEFHKNRAGWLEIGEFMAKEETEED